MSSAGLNPQNALDDVSSLRARTRASRPRFSVALLLVSAFTFGAMPFYVLRPFEEGWPQTSRFVTLAGYAGVRTPDLATLYWLIGVPLFYALLVGYFAWSGNRSGVKLRTSLWVISGVALFAATLTAMYLPGIVPLPGNLAGRGLLPLLTIAVALAFWGGALRSTGLIVASSLGLAASLVANLYNVENILAPGSLDYQYRLVLNLALPACVYLLGAAAMEVSRIRPRQ